MSPNGCGRSLQRMQNAIGIITKNNKSKNEKWNMSFLSLG
jgi:hypothetical protein